jgi:hypothetical protein
MTTYLAKALHTELFRIAKEEGVKMAELVDEIAALVGKSPRHLYNYSSGKWPVPSHLIPVLCRRFKSKALLDALATDLESADIHVPEDYDLVRILASSLGSVLISVLLK